MKATGRTAALQKALARHRDGASPYYDEVIDQVSRGAEASGYMGKSEIGALVLWKRLNASTRWARDLMDTSEQTVRAATSAARQAAINPELTVPMAASQARSALSSLPGFTVGDALASAVIYALAPSRMAVYDRRAQAGLEGLGLELTARPGRYGRYMALIEDLRAEAKATGTGTELSARQVDLALFALGGARLQ